MVADKEQDGDDQQESSGEVESIVAEQHSCNSSPAFSYFYCCIMRRNE
jgi:hypothetical protein